jgi:hypothetical protein
MCSVYFDIIIPLKYKNFYFWFTQTGKRNFCLFFKLSIKKKILNSAYFYTCDQRKPLLCNTV